MSNHRMEYKGFRASIMEAERLTGDHVHELPPGRPVEVYHVDEFLKPPENWMKGPGSYVVPVKANKGLWFDWTSNDNENTAILPTVKGCNPVTGMQTSGFHLEKYDTKCPKHGCDFLAERFCPQCNYKWPFGNYVAGPNRLWWDGFRSDDGFVRQFFFTEEEIRDVATAMIGKENTIPAFGFAFYSPKVPRPRGSMRGSMPVHYLSMPIANVKYSSGTLMGQMIPDVHIYNTSTGFNGPAGASGTSGSVGTTSATSSLTIGAPGAQDSDDAGAQSGSQEYGCDSIKVLSKMSKRSRGFSKGITKSAGVNYLSASNAGGQSVDMSYNAGVVKEFYSPQMSTDSLELPVECAASAIVEDVKVETKEVSVGAGAKILQDLIPDPHPLDSWKDTPDSVITLYFVFQDQFEKIRAGGMRDLSGVKEGMLAGIPVG